MHKRHKEAQMLSALCVFLVLLVLRSRPRSITWASNPLDIVFESWANRVLVDASRCLQIGKGVDPVQPAIEEFAQRRAFGNKIPVIIDAAFLIATIDRLLVHAL